MAEPGVEGDHPGGALDDRRNRRGAGTYLVYPLSRGIAVDLRDRGFRIGQIGSASMVSLAHGTNDAQKTIGIITLALIADGALPANAKAPFWVILTCALAISLGTYIGGRRVIRALGKGLVEIEAPQGMAAESASAAAITLSSGFGYSLSTTHVATGSILGTGVGKKGAEVRWGVAGRGGQLSTDDVTAIADELAESGDPASAESIRRAIANVAHVTPQDSECPRVRSRLAAGGWPLAAPQYLDRPSP